MPAHSPGPWTAEPANHCSPLDLLNPEPDYWYIDGPGADVYGVMSAADAYLIESAPDLLEVLQRLLADAEHVRKVSLREVGIDMVDEIALEAARAAIAKATRKWTP